MTFLAFGLSLDAGLADEAASGPLAVTGLTTVMTVHAEGSQIYECDAGSAGLAWQFKEPNATLLVDGKPVGVHFAGPTWTIGATTIKGKVAEKKAGATPFDVPWLRLDVTENTGTGPLGSVTTVERMNTRGGNLAGTCPTAGIRRRVAYSADYAFLKK